MKTISFNRLFLISLFTISCPSIFTESPENTLTNNIQQNQEVFQELMTMSRDHTKEIGWCAQQILQTLCNNKEQYKIENKKNVIEVLKQIQSLTQKIDLEIYSKNTREALVQGVIFNNGITHFLSQGLNSKFSEFDFITFVEQLHKRSGKDISDETIFEVIQKNDAAVKTLLDEIGQAGLTWYNVLHRKMKEYNVYDITKKTAVFSAGLLVTAVVLCSLNKNTEYNVEDSYWRNLANRVIGFAPIECKNTDPINPMAFTEGCIYKALSTDATGKTTIQNFSTPQHLSQNVLSVYESIKKSGFASIAPLFSINLAGIYSYCFGDSYSWAKNKYQENIETIDKFLDGSKANKNINADGQEKVYFDDLIGCEELKELAQQLANFIQHPEYYERSKTEGHRGILLYGPPQTGKSNFAKALRTLIQETVGDSKKIGFIDGKSLIDKGFSIEDIFEYAAYMAPCILFLDEIDLIGTNREKDPAQTGKLLTCMQGIDITSKQIIVIGATNRIEQLDKALLVDGRFGKQIFIDYPEYQYRKQFIENELTKRAITLSENFIDHMAQETDGCSYNNLKRIITEAIIISGNERRLVCQDDFEKTLDVEIRKIYFGSRNKSTQAEKQIIAAYQAGKAIIRHVLCTDKEIIKITIEDVARTIKSKKTGYALSIGEEHSSENEKFASEKNESKIKFGEVFAKSKNNSKDLISDQELKKECLVLLAGNIAQQIILGQSYSQCNKHDRADAMQMLYHTIAQGEKIDDKVRAQAAVIKDAYEKEIFTILENNKEILGILMNILVEDITIDRYEWSALIS